MATNHYDVAIVGGGHNGLVAGAYLARSGLRTVVLEQRELAGGLAAAVEYFPGYTASMTNSPGSIEPRIVNDLGLETRFGLRFLRPDPAVIFPFPNATAFVGWRDRNLALEEIAKFSARDAKQYYPFFDYLEEFARLLNVSIFAPPPPFAELVRDIAGARAEEMFSKIMFGSVQDLLDEWFESDEVKALIASVAIVSNLAGPRSPGTVMRLLARPLSLASSPVGDLSDPRRQVMRGSTGIPVGGMGAIARAMADSFKAAGGEIRTGATVERITTDNGAAHAVVLADGEEITARIVLSNVNPKSTFLNLVAPSDLPPDFLQQVRALRMRGSIFKVGLALDAMPEWAAATDETSRRLFASCQFRIAPSLEYMERAFDDAKYGRPSSGPMLWGLTPSMMDSTVTPEGKHIMSINVFHAPHELAGMTWADERERYGNHCIDAMCQYVPNLRDIITDVRFWSPQDIIDEYGLYEANITHGETMPGQMFSFRPIPGWSAYRTPVRGLYLCGAGTWPGGSVTGVPGHNASHAVLADLGRGLLDRPGPVEEIAT